MTDVEQLAGSKDYNNYSSVNTALSLIGQHLEPYTKQKLTSVHQQVVANIGTQTCNRQCSTYPNRRRNCPICSAWRRELGLFLKFPGSQLHWWQLNSWKFPGDPVSIAEFFLPHKRNVKNINLKDLSTTVNIWNTCKVFPTPLITGIQPLRTVRNDVVHHFQATQLITDTEKADIFLDIFNTLKVPDVQATIDSYNMLVQKLQNLEKNGMPTKYEILIKRLEKTMKEMKTKMDKIFQYLKTFALAFIILLVGVVAVATYHLYEGKGTSDIRDSDSYKYRKEGCLSEEPHMLFKEQMIQMHIYISKHTTLVGRRWFFKNLEDHLNEDSARHGVIVIAGRGYGKTALVANMVCASSTEASYQIRRHLVAYYICRFDSLVTKKNHIFIRRLASLFSNNIPGFSDILIKNDSFCGEYFNSARCNEDTSACITHCLISPLDKLPVPKHSYIVLIDALDECEDTTSSSNDIAVLLRHNLNLIPEWIKFIITCRDVAYCMPLTTQLYKMDLSLIEHHNQDDLKTYSIIHGFNHNDVGAANFLLASAHVTLNTPGVKIPTMDIYYEIEFERYFDHQYFECAVILEIICSSFETMTEQTLQNIVLSTGKITLTKYEETMKHLSNLIQDIGDRIHLWHASLKEWLLKTKSKFEINVPRGHHYVANDLLEQVQSKHADIDIILLVIHASLAYTYSDESILKFDKLNISALIEIDIIKTEYPLHRLASDFDSYLAMDHLIKQFPRLEILDKNEHTPAYLAASHGNLESLKSLHDAGANMNFKTRSSFFSFEEAYETYHWDHKVYSILDIAAQNGHLSVVKYIVEHLNYSLHKRNERNLLPIHLACKLGNTEIVEYFHENYILKVDSLCLYFAAERGHIELVSYLLQINVKDNCKSCGSHLHYIPKRKSRIQYVDMILNDFEDYNGMNKFYHDWNQMACETALHASVRLNHVKIVKLLVSNSNSMSAYYCFDRVGRTPLISALQYNRTEIVKEFLDSKLIKTTMKCGQRKVFADFRQLNVVERYIFTSYFCCIECTIMHITAYFDRLWFVKLLKHYNVSIIWNVRDSSGCSPVHTAACLGSSLILEYVLENMKDEAIESKCNDGSTPLEIAASCSTFGSLSILLNSSKARSQYLNTELKRSLVFKTLNRSTADILPKHAKAIQTSICQILDSLLDYSLDIMYLQNIYQQNILHIALMNGHFGIVNKLMENFPAVSKELMTSFHNNSENPLQLAISKLEDTENVLYYTHANAYTLQNEYMSSTEHSISIALEFIEKYNLFSDTDIKTMLISLISKNYGSITLGYLAKHSRHFGDHDFIHNVLVKDSSNVVSARVIKKMIMYREAISENPSMCVNNCEEIVRKCHLHTIALKYRQLYEISKNFESNEVEIMFDFKLNHRYPDMLSNCYDEEGYNVLERAVQGRSLELVTYLLNIGVKSNKPMEYLIWLAIVPFTSPKYTDYLAFAQPVSHETNVYKVYKKSNLSKRFKEAVTTFSLYSRVESTMGYFTAFLQRYVEYTCIDTVVATLIVKFRDHLNANSFCSKEKRYFSLVHIAAMHRMTWTLSNISKIYGIDVLNCSNIHFITPLYLANALRQYDVKTILNSMNLRPSYEIIDETNLFLEFYLTFLTKLYGKKYIRCVFSYSKVVPRNMYKIIKGWLCVRKVAQTLKHSSSVRNSLHVIKLYNYLQFKHICTTKCKQLFLPILNHKRDSVFLRFLNKMDNNMLKTFQRFRSAVEKCLEIQYDLKNNALDQLDQFIFELEHNPSHIRGCPDFNVYEFGERQAWGYLRSNLRQTIVLLKVVIAKEIRYIYDRTFMFSDNLYKLNLTYTIQSLKNLPAYNYVSVIERLPFFDDVFDVLIESLDQGRTWTM